MQNTTIITCAACGAKNRVRDTSDQLPICGQCRTPFTVSSFREVFQPQRPSASIIRRKIPQIIFITITTLVGLAFLYPRKSNDQNSSEPNRKAETTQRSENNSSPISTIPRSAWPSPQFPSKDIEPSLSKHPPASVASTNSQDQNVGVKSLKNFPVEEISTSTSSSSISKEIPNPSITPIPQPSRYASGTNLMRPQALGGRGVLQISNGTSSDAIAKLVDSKTNKTLRCVYMQASSKTTMSSIKVGDYILKFSLGQDHYYDGSLCGRFQKTDSFERFDNILEFREYKTDDRVRWWEFDVTLDPVINGNAQTSLISEADFEDH